MVAFVASVLVLIAMLVPLAWYREHRPVGTPVSWGEAMVAGTYVFLLLFWIYGVVPHQWLTLADSEWNWRPDRILLGPGDVFEILPFTMTYEAARDLIVVGIYLIGLAGHVALWAWWQGRGEPRQVEVERSAFGRPLVREGA